MKADSFEILTNSNLMPLSACQKLEPSAQLQSHCVCVCWKVQPLPPQHGDKNLSVRLSVRSGLFPAVVESFVCSFHFFFLNPSSCHITNPPPPSPPHPTLLCPISPVCNLNILCGSIQFASLARLSKRGITGFLHARASPSAVPLVSSSTSSSPGSPSSSSSCLLFLRTSKLRLMAVLRRDGVGELCSLL